MHFSVEQYPDLAALIGILLHLQSLEGLLASAEKDG
jgi:hypothetical protein